MPTPARHGRWFNSSHSDQKGTDRKSGLCLFV